MYQKIISKFGTVSLEQLNKRALLQNRCDIKYVFSVNLLSSILATAADHYDILQVNSNSVFKYRTVYYDTDDMQFYNHHHNGKATRLKVRCRTYPESNLSFLEVKIKNNKGRTIKYRKKIEFGMPELQLEFIKKVSPASIPDLYQMLTVNYDRITLLHKQNSERITLDLAPVFSSKSNQVGYEGIVIAEIKVEHRCKTDFAHILRSFNIREGSISKYCLGLISLNKSVKHNNFKTQFNYLQKINKSNEPATDN